MKNNVIFYKCKSIDEQLILVMREYLKLNLDQVVINIPKGQRINDIMQFFNKRKFKYSVGEYKKGIPRIKILNEDKLENNEVNFYLIYNKINNKQEFINKLKKLDNELNIIVFTNLNNIDLNQIIENGFEIYNYRKSFISRLNNTSMQEERELEIKEESYTGNHLINEQIRNKFIETFFIAEKEINIISPWISEVVVDDEFIGLLEDTLKRNITIKILYGIGKNDDDRNKKSENIALSLISRFKKYGSLFKIKKDNIHYKLLICDDKYLISGSFNFLSFKGDYEGDDNRSEGAEYIENKEDINLKRKIYFNY